MYHCLIAFFKSLLFLFDFIYAFGLSVMFFPFPLFNILLLLHPFTGMSSFILLLLFGRIFFRYYYHSHSLRVFHLNVSWWSFTWVWVTMSPHVSRTLPSNLADFNNAVVCIVSILSFISKSFSPSINLLVPRAPVIIFLVRIVFPYQLLFLCHFLSVS